MCDPAGGKVKRKVADHNRSQPDWKLQGIVDAQGVVKYLQRDYDGRGGHETQIKSFLSKDSTQSIFREFYHYIDATDIKREANPPEYRLGKGYKDTPSSDAFKKCYSVWDKFTPGVVGKRRLPCWTCETCKRGRPDQCVREYLRYGVPHEGHLPLKNTASDGARIESRQAATLRANYPEAAALLQGQLCVCHNPQTRQVDIAVVQRQLHVISVGDHAGTPSFTVNFLNRDIAATTTSNIVYLKNSTSAAVHCSPSDLLSSLQGADVHVARRIDGVSSIDNNDLQRLAALFTDPADTDDVSEGAIVQVSGALGADVVPKDVPEDQHQALIEELLAQGDVRRREEQPEQFDDGEITDASVNAILRTAPEQEETFVVEDILDIGTCPQVGLVFKVSWRNFGPMSNTWEPVHGFDGEPCLRATLDDDQLAELLGAFYERGHEHRLAGSKHHHCKAKGCKFNTGLSMEPGTGNVDEFVENILLLGQELWGPLAAAAEERSARKRKHNPKDTGKSTVSQHSWSAAEIEALKEGVVVWAQPKGYPLWPAKILQVTEIVGNNFRVKVQYFGDSNVGMVKNTTARPFKSAADRFDCHKKLRSDDEDLFARSVEEAESYRTQRAATAVVPGRSHDSGASTTQPSASGELGCGATADAATRAAPVVDGAAAVPGAIDVNRPKRAAPKLPSTRKSKKQRNDLNN